MTVKVYEWTPRITFNRATAGGDHPQISGQKFWTGRPKANGLARASRFILDAGGVVLNPGIVELVRARLRGGHIIRMADPRWIATHDYDIRFYDLDIRWSDRDDPNWTDDQDAGWVPALPLRTGATAAGAGSITLYDAIPDKKIFLEGDEFKVGGQVLMAADVATSASSGAVTVKLAFPLVADVTGGEEVEYPVKRLWSLAIPPAKDQGLSVLFDWEGQFTEVFESDYSSLEYGYNFHDEAT